MEEPNRCSDKGFTHRTRMMCNCELFFKMMPIDFAARLVQISHLIRELSDGSCQSTGGEGVYDTGALLLQQKCILQPRYAE